MKLLASAFTLAALSFAVPAYASGDTAADRRHVQTAQDRGATPGAIPAPGAAKPEEACAASCPCAKGEGVIQDGITTRREPGLH
jgi:hypothetical protein